LDDPELAETTRQIFLAGAGPRDQEIVPHGNVSSFSARKTSYENVWCHSFVGCGFLRMARYGEAVR